MENKLGDNNMEKHCQWKKMQLVDLVDQSDFNRS